MRRFAFLVACVFAAPPAFCADRVAAEDHREFWLWGGVKSRPYFDRAETIYLLQGEVATGPGGVTQVEARSVASPGPHRAPLFLVWRTRTLDFSPGVFEVIRARLAAWKRERGVVRGVQIDFDAATKRLGDYAAFLRKVRQELPVGTELSVTGLMDWASQGALDDLGKLAGVTDEIVFQTYRGRSTARNVEAYVARLARLAIPFKLGLVEHGEWSPPPGLRGNPNFLGYVVFLLNRAPTGAAGIE